MKGTGWKAALLVYVVALPLLWPPLAEIREKVVVAADPAFVVLLVLLWCAPGCFYSPRGGLLLAGALPPAAIALAAAVTGALASAVPDLLRVSYSMAVLLVLAHVRLSREEVLALASAWTAAGLAVAVFGLVAWTGVVACGWAPNPLAGASSPNLGGEVVRVSSTMGSNALALCLGPWASLAIFVLAAPDASSSQRRLARMGLGSAVLVAPFTMSRGLVGFALTLALLCGSAGRVRPTLRRTAFFGGVAASGLAVAAILATLWAVFPVRIHRDKTPNRLEWNTRPNAYRVLHVAGLRMFASHPWAGVGPGRFGARLAHYTRPEEREGAWPPVRPSRVDYDPHSTWIGWAAESGWIGLAGWAALHGRILRDLWRARGLAAPLGLADCAVAVLAGVLVNGLHTEISHLKLLWAYLGLAIAGERGQGIVDPAELTAEKLYLALRAKGRLLAAGQRPVSEKNRFFISKPDVALPGVKLSADGGFDPEFKYGAPRASSIGTP